MAEQAETHELPLFLLNTVLFPRMELPLRVFEQRYREMVAFCMERDQTFGVVLIKHGNEIGIPAVPYSVGTTTHIDSIENLADGTLAVMTSGVRRFVLEEVIQERPFQIGRVTYPDDTANPLSDTAFAEMRELAARCVQRWLALNRQWMREPPLPRSQRGLSFSIATRLPLEMDVKQMLLECPSASERLEKERTLLAQEEERLNRLILEQAWLQTARMN